MSNEYAFHSNFWLKVVVGVSLIVGALKILQFVDAKVQWMHIDMAGPVWNDKKKSATGFGVSTLVEWVLKNSA